MEPRELFICDDEQIETSAKNKRALTPKEKEALAEQEALARQKALETMRELHKMLSESDD